MIGYTAALPAVPYAPFNPMVTKISKCSRIQDSCWIAPKIESPVVYATPDIPSKFQKDSSITFWVILLTHRQTNKQTNKNRQKHNLLGGGNKALVLVTIREEMTTELLNLPATAMHLNCTLTQCIKYKKTYQFTLLCKGDRVTHPKQQKSFY